MNKTKRVSLMKRRKRSNKLQIKTKLENPVVKTRTPARTALNEVVAPAAAKKAPAAAKKAPAAAKKAPAAAKKAPAAAKKAPAAAKKAPAAAKKAPAAAKKTTKAEPTDNS